METKEPKMARILNAEPGLTALRPASINKGAKMFTDTWHADGSGIYSWIAWEVEILDMCVDVCDEQDFGELRVYFNTKGVNGWDV